jgi:hypothetical protein
MHTGQKSRCSFYPLFTSDLRHHRQEKPDVLETPESPRTGIRPVPLSARELAATLYRRL